MPTQKSTRRGQVPTRLQRKLKKTNSNDLFMKTARLNGQTRRYLITREALAAGWKPDGSVPSWYQALRKNVPTGCVPAEAETQPSAVKQQRVKVKKKVKKEVKKELPRIPAEPAHIPPPQLMLGRQHSLCPAGETDDFDLVLWNMIIDDPDLFSRESIDAMITE